MGKANTGAMTSSKLRDGIINTLFQERLTTLLFEWRISVAHTQSIYSGHRKEFTASIGASEITHSYFMYDNTVFDGNVGKRDNHWLMFFVFFFCHVVFLTFCVF